MSELYLSRWIFALKKAADRINFCMRLTHVLLLSQPKSPLVEAIFGIVVLLSH
jgi:hypothetical protein